MPKKCAAADGLPYIGWTIALKEVDWWKVSSRDANWEVKLFQPPTWPASVA